MKKNYLLCAVFLIASWVSWSSIRAAVFINENFDTLTTQLPAGWDNSRGNTTEYYRWQVTEYEYYGDVGKSLIFNSYNNQFGYTNVLLTPAFTPNGFTMVEFAYKNPAGGDFSVYLTVDDGVNYIDTLARGLKANDWTVRQFDISEYAGRENLRVVFHSTSNMGSAGAYHHLDNVYVGDMPQCPQPVDVLVSNLKQTSVDISWALSLGVAVPSKYHVLVKDASYTNTVFDDTLALSAGAVVPVSGLTAGTDYVAIVRSDCSETNQDVSDTSKHVFFTTLHAPQSLPYPIDFDSSDDDPEGTIIRGGAFVTASSAYGDEGKSLWMQSMPDEASWFITSPIAHAANDLQITAKIYSADEGLDFSVGVILDPSDPTSFVPVFEDSITVKNEWVEYRFNTAAYQNTASGAMVAFFVPGGSQDYESLFVDEIKIEVIPSCMRPEKLTASLVDSASVTLKWEEFAGATKYVVRYASLKDTVDVDASTNPYVLKDLDEATQYTISVRNVCQGTDSSEWSNPVTVKTMCKTMSKTLFVESFENGIPSCWAQRQSVLGKGNGNNKGNKFFDYGWDSKSGDKALALPFGSSKADARYLLVSQPVYIDEAGKYDLSFWYKRHAFKEWPAEGINVWISNVSDTVGARKLGFIPSSILFAPEENSSGYYQYTYNIDLQGAVYIIFEAVSMKGSNAFIDDVEVKIAPQCRQIDYHTVQFTDTTLNSLTMEWGAAGGETQWLLEYTLTSATDTVADTVPIMNTPTFTFPNLKPATEYYLSGNLAAVCGTAVGDTSDFIDVDIIFPTDCEIATMPFAESFEGATFPPICWSQRQIFLGQGGSYWSKDHGDKAWIKTTHPDYVAMGKGAAELQQGYNGTRTLLISPLMDIPADKDYQLSFYTYRNIVNDPDAGVRVWVNSVPDTLGATELMYIRSGIGLNPKEETDGMYKYFAPIGVSGPQYILFEGINGGDYSKPVYIDHIRVDEMPPCAEMRPFVVDSIAITSACVEIIDTVPTTWEAECGKKGYQPGTGEKFTGTGRTARLTGLDPDTEYDVYIRRVCGTDYSAWNEQIVSFRTLCDGFEVTSDAPFHEGFEEFDTEETIKDCYHQEVIESNYLWYATDKQFSAGYYSWDLQPYNGSRFAYKQMAGSTWLFRAVKLKANTKYEVAAYVTHSATDKFSTAKASLAVATAPKGAAVIDTLLLDHVFANSWNRVTGYFTAPADGIYYIGWSVEQTYATQRVGMDDLSVTEVNCIPPTDFVVDEVGHDTAVFKINVATAERHILKIFSSDRMPEENLDVALRDTFDTDRYVARSLTPNTDYIYYIAPLCDGEVGPWTMAKELRTECYKAEAPIFEGFEDSEMTDFRCWTVSGDRPEFSLNTTRKNTGKSSLLVKNADITTPELDVDRLDKYMISGYVYTVYDSLTFTIGVTEVPGDVTAYEEMATILLPKSDKWTEFTAYFNVLSEEGFEDYNPKYIVISGLGNKPFYFDDLRIDTMPSCPKPSVVNITDVEARSFTMEWNTVKDEKQWNIRVENEGVLVYDTVVIDNPCTLDGLLPATHYSISMAVVCSATDTSDYINCGEFVTDCAPMTLPFTMNLRQDDAGNLPLCWNRNEGNCYESNQWRAREDTEGMVMIFSEYGSYYDYWQTLYSPIIDLANQIDPVLYLNLTHYKSDSLFIFLSDNGGVSYDIALDTIPVTDTDQGVGYQYDLSDYVGSQISVAFEAHGGDNYGSKAQINSFSVIASESCSRLTGLISKAVEQTQFVAELTDTTSTHAAWEMVIGKAGFNPNSGQPVPLTGKMHTFTDLDHSTYYHVYARAVCDAVAGDKSAWYGPLVVKTACGIPSLPYFEGFESYENDRQLNDACILFLNQHTDSSDPTYPYASINKTDNHTEGSIGLRLVSSDEFPIYAVLPVMDEPLNQLLLEFDYKNESMESGNAPLVVGMVNADADMSTFVEVKKLPVRNWFAATEKIAFDTVAGLIEGGRIAFRYGGGGIARQLMFMDIDAITVRSLTECPEIEQVSLVDATAQSVTVDVDSRHAAQYQVVYGLMGSPLDSCKQSFIADNDTITISGLAKAQGYTAYIRAVCAAGDTSEYWSAPFYFSTECDVINVDADNKWVENFDTYDYLPAPFPPCFNRLVVNDKEDKLYPELHEEYTVSEPYSLHFKGRNMVALPRFNRNVAELQLSFTIRGKGNIYIGVADALDRDSVKYVDYFYALNKVTRLDYDMTKYDVDADYFVLYTQSDDADFSIDSLVVELAPTCYEPRKLVVTDIMDSSVVVSWKKAPDVVSFDYMITTFAEGKTDTVQSGNLAGEILSSTFADLDAATDYNFHIRGICGTGETKDTTTWSKLSFRTLIPLAVTPYTTGFENAEDNGYWSMIKGTPYLQYQDAFHIGTEARGVKTGLKALYVSNDEANYKYSGATPNVLEIFHAYRLVYLESGEYSLSFDYRGSGVENAGTVDNYGMAFLMPYGEPLLGGERIEEGVDKYRIFVNRLYGAGSWTSFTGTAMVSRPGVYRLVIGWRQSSAAGTSTPLAVDNIVLDKVSCARLDSVNVSSIGTDSAWVSIINYNGVTDVEYKVEINGIEVAEDTVARIPFVLDNLTPNTEYTIKLRALCSQTEQSEWVQTSFYTECMPVVITAENPYFEGFESYEYGAESSSTKLGNCWSSNDDYNYNRLFVRNERDEWAREPYDGVGYLSVPGNFSGFAVRDFVLEASKTYTVSYRAKQNETNGCVMSVLVNGQIIFTKVVGKEWVEVTTDFRAPTSGVYSIGLQAENGYQVGYVSVDNFSVSELVLVPPYDITLDSVGTTTAKIIWSGVTDDYRLKLYEGSELKVDSLIHDTVYRAAGLNAGINYTARIWAVDGEMSSNEATFKFTTDCGVATLPFMQDFSSIAVDRMPVCWDLIRENTQSSYTWKVFDVKGNNALGIYVSDALGRHEARLIPISMEGRKSMLSFDYNVESQTDSLELYVSTDGGATYSEKLFVGRKTVGMENANIRLDSYKDDTITLSFVTTASTSGIVERILVDNIYVNCATDDITHKDTVCPNMDYSLYGFNITKSQIETGGKEYRFSRFVKGTASGECDHYEYLILTTKRGGITLIDTTICEGGVYTSEAFPNGMSMPGFWTSNVKLVSKDGCDSIVKLNLTVADPHYKYSDTICAGESYPFAGKTLTETGIYHDTLPGASTYKCDSIISLTLVVQQTHFPEVKTVCFNEIYEWCDTTLTTSGKYTKIFERKQGSCDSIHTIDFTVLPDTFRIDTTICEGQSFMLGKDECNTTGIYIKRFEETTFKCDSVVKLNLTVTPADTVPSDIENEVCQGDEYFGNGFSGIVITKDTILYKKESDPDGCITFKSIIVKNIPPVVIDTTITLPAGSTYTFCGTTYTTSTKATCDEVSTVTGCDSITNLTLVIGEGSAVDGSHVLPLTLAPNPVHLGQPTFVHRTWTPEEQRGLTVEVLNSVGQIVYSDRPEYYPIRLIGMEVSGVYYIRITTGTGEIYVGKLIVK